LLRIKNIIATLFTLVVTFIVSPSYAQVNSDSLDIILSEYKTPKDKVNFLNEKSKEFWKSDTTKAFTYIDRAIKIGKNNNLYSSLGDSYRYIGNIYHNLGFGKQTKSSYFNSYEYYTLSEDSLGLAKITNNLGSYYDQWPNDYDRALLYFQKSLRLKKSLKIDEKSIATTYYNLGSAHLHLSNYIKSLKFFFKSLEILERTKEYDRVADIQNRIAKVYLDLKEQNKVIKYLKLSVELNREVGNEIQLANDYLLYGALYVSLNKLDSALVKLKESEVIYSNYVDLLGLGRVYNSYIDIYIIKEDFDNVFKYAHLAEEIFNKSGSIYDLSLIHSNLGVAYYKTGDYNKSLEYLTKSNKISSQYGFLEISMKNYLYLGEINYVKHKYKEAYQFFIDYTALKDSTFNIKKAKIASEMEDKYAINKKEIELDLLSQEKQKIEFERDRNKTVSNYLKLIIILVLIVLSLIFYLYYSNKRLNDRLEELVEERTKELKESNKLLANSKKNEEDVSRIKSDLLKNISESLKTPITEIQSLVKILKGENEENDELYEQLELITNSTFRLTAIISSITELYNIEDKRKVARSDEFELDGLISGIINSHQNQAEARDLNLVLETGQNAIWFRQDMELISNAVDHLLKTVVDYANKGEVVIRLTQNQSSKNIEIYSSHFNINQKVFNNDLSTNTSSINSDNKQLDRMFISLFVTKKMIEKMEGKIYWESANKGEGIRFIMNFSNESIV
jgi:signal transduction histidine kinase